MSDWLLGAYFFVMLCLPWLLATAAWSYASRYHRKALEWKDRAEKAEAKAAYAMLKVQGFDVEEFGKRMKHFGVSLEQARTAFAEYAKEASDDE